MRAVATRASLTPSQITALFRLTDLLLESNRQYNLTAIRTRDAVLAKHVADALTLLPLLDRESPSKIIDVGTGAGFPGFVLAIARPDAEVTLLDCARKKTKFHDVVLAELPLPNVRSVWARAEEAGRDDLHRERYGFAVARSVAEMRVLSELCVPLVGVGGVFVAQKSVEREQREVRGAEKAIKLLGGTLESVEPAWEDGVLTDAAESEDADGRRKSLVIVRKVSPTPRAYPRPPGAPKKHPL